MNSDRRAITQADGRIQKASCSCLLQHLLECISYTKSFDLFLLEASNPPSSAGLELYLDLIRGPQKYYELMCANVFCKQRESNYLSIDRRPFISYLISWLYWVATGKIRTINHYIYNNK